MGLGRSAGLMAAAAMASLSTAAQGAAVAVTDFGDSYRGYVNTSSRMTTASSQNGRAPGAGMASVRAARKLRNQKRNRKAHRG